jgi:hypothetical protein
MDQENTTVRRTLELDPMSILHTCFYMETGWKKRPHLLQQISARLVLSLVPLRPADIVPEP